MCVHFDLWYAIFWMQFSISLSVICPKELPKIKGIYNAVRMAYHRSTKILTCLYMFTSNMMANKMCYVHAV